MPTRLVIDTDIGTDVDDLWTLAMLPRLDGVALEAITTVYGDTDLRARMVSAVLGAMDITVPVHAGCEQPLSGRPVMWAGHEGDGVPGIAEASYASGDAVDVLVELAAREPGTLNILAIGPLTNIATAIARDPAFRTNVGRLFIMGGEFKSDWPEHNFRCDAVATEAVLRSGMDITIMPFDQTIRVLIDQADVARIALAHPLGALMAEHAHTFWTWLAGVAPNIPRNISAAHDPAALLTLVQPHLFTVTPMAMQFDVDEVFEGRLRGTPDPTSSIQVVTDLDPDAVRSAFLKALGCPDSFTDYRGAFAGDGPTTDALRQSERDAEATAESAKARRVGW